MARNGKCEIARDIYFMAEHQDYMRRMRGVTKENLYELTLEMRRLIISSSESAPVKMLFNVFNQLSECKSDFTIPVHGEWHHSLVPGVMLSALRNSGYGISDKDIEEGMMRGSQAKVSCGFTGVCGGANSFGIVIAIVKKITPLHGEERTDLMRSSALVLQKIAAVEGRCCKRSTYIGMGETIKYLARIDIALPYSDIACPFPAENSKCARERCPYFRPAGVGNGPRIWNAGRIEEKYGNASLSTINPNKGDANL